MFFVFSFFVVYLSRGTLPITKKRGERKGT